MIGCKGQVATLRNYFMGELRRRLKKRHASVIKPNKSIVYTYIVGMHHRIIDMVNIDTEEFGFTDPLTGMYMWLSLDHLSVDQIGELLDEIFDDRFAIEE